MAENIFDDLYMLRALSLAQAGAGYVSPNPMVGCVIVHQHQIIGEGWHQQYGGPHAEVNAIASVADVSLLPSSTLYVTLEPCSHFGKTPPCADLLLHHRISRVVVSNLDPNPLVAGKGLAKLREAGIAVRTGVLEAEGRVLNRRFFTFMEKKRPYIVLKWAQTADGFIARTNYDSKWISNWMSRKLVHKWRSEEMGIMVGTHTAIYDNPKLNVRSWAGKHPLRIVLDRQGRIPATHELMSDGEPTLVYGKTQHTAHSNIMTVPIHNQTRLLEEMMNDLHSRGILSILVEGGRQLLQGLIDAHLWDEARVFRGTQHFSAGIAAPILTSSILIEENNIINDKLSIYTHSHQGEMA